MKYVRCPKLMMFFVLFFFFYHVEKKNQELIWERDNCNLSVDQLY